MDVETKIRWWPETAASARRGLKSPAATHSRHRSLGLFLLFVTLTACTEPPLQTLGTLEYERITLPAPAAERIVAIAVREGERVEAGATIIRLEPARLEARTDVLRADALRQRDVLAELEAGSRRERIAQAKAQLAAGQASAAEARRFADRLEPLGRAGVVAPAEVDRASAAAASAEAQVAAQAAFLSELENGTRREQVAQAQSAIAAAEAQVMAQTLDLAELEIKAPRAGVIDSLPYEVGDRAPTNAPLATLLVGDTPYARVYVPAALRLGVKSGTRARIQIAGQAAPLPGRVRAIRHEPSFTPYFALSGEDASRLCYLAEIELDAPIDLPAGLPVAVFFEGQ